MKNRLIITVSDVHGTRAFNIHQIAKKLIVFIILTVVIVLGGAFWFISELNTQMDTLKEEKQKEIQKKEQEITVLTEKEKKTSSSKSVLFYAN